MLVELRGRPETSLPLIQGAGLRTQKGPKLTVFHRLALARLHSLHHSLLVFVMDDICRQLSVESRMQFVEEVCSVLSGLLVKGSPMFGRLLCPNIIDRPDIKKLQVVYLKNLRH